jgi:hydrogenase maturation protein HypF
VSVPTIHKAVTVQRLHIVIRGAVQGVGFRPFVYRLATEMDLTGWVVNSAQGVFIEVEGDRTSLEAFLLRLDKEKPPRAFIQSLEYSLLDPLGYTAFEIRQSDESGEKTALVLPDIATCPDCLREIVDPSNRRYRYPFTNCTNCGPRFTIIESLPYDRPRTSMKMFTMCEECQREYDDPLDRRFHAQPNACPRCGPHLELWNDAGAVLYTHDEALAAAAAAIRSGKIVALKGLGGFHLVVDARNDDAVNRLRRRKHREEKPFALMYPSLDLVRGDCSVSDLEERLLLSPESPIVLLNRKADIGYRTSSISPSVAPNNPCLGIMLPYTPLHHLLLRELRFPVVATSGNLSDEPICTDEHEALHRLHSIADLFLVHNRPIVRHVDDSIVRVMMGRQLLLRRARGYAPLPIHLRAAPESPPVLAVGAHLKNTVALSVGTNIFVSQHIGDLETKEAFGAFQKVIADFQQLYQTESPKIVCDLHPDYLSSQFARTNGIAPTTIQHHYAHVVSCMAENELEGRVLGVSWDGTGYGLDGTVWGGEFLLTNDTSFERVASFRTFRLPGGETAIKEPRRSAIGVLYEMFGDGAFERTHLTPLQSFTDSERAVLNQMLARGINSPLTSSVGRLFDAVASMTGLRQRAAFEGQAAMELEFAIHGCMSNRSYSFRLMHHANHSAPAALRVDWEPMVQEILEDIEAGTATAEIAGAFHNTLTEIIVDVAKQVGVTRIVLTGGCFQNKYLTERTVQRLEAEGFRPYWHQRIPPNDGGISVGQVCAFLRAHSTGSGALHPVGMKVETFR